MKDLFRAAGAVDVTETDMDDIFYQADANGNGSALGTTPLFLGA